MIELNSSHRVQVTAEQRIHPALRKLARACIALALVQLAGEASPDPSAAEPAVSADTRPKEDTAASGQEDRHA